MDSIFIQLLIEFFGAFLGFLFAVLLAGISERIEHKKKNIMILRSLNEELNDITAAIKQYIENKIVLNARIAIPTWDALQNTGMTLELIGAHYFDKLVTAYALIKSYNEDRLHDKPLTVNRLQEIVQVCEEALFQLKKEGL